MENNKKIIILLLIIIAILAIAIGYLVFSDINKQECELSINCNKTMNKGDNIIIKLKDLNNNPISNATINLKLIKGNTTEEHQITTNDKGTGKFTLKDLSDGNYKIECSFNGNDHYKKTNKTKKFKFEKEVATSSSSSGQSSSSNSIDSNRPVNDPNYKGYNPYHESEVTADGWNPQEHEVSRQQLSDGSEKVKYDDGYFRIVDDKGYVITYGYR